jgi:peptidoglycan/LPS O-acetylase OafA/YrhL
MPRLPRHPGFWLTAFLFWFGVLWALSSSGMHGGGDPLVPNFDKIAHFGYFFGGSGLLGAWLYRRNPEKPNWWKIIATSILVIAMVGALDEFHQRTPATGRPTCLEALPGPSSSSGFITC